MSSGKHQQHGTHAAEPEKANFQGKYKWMRNEELEDYLSAIGWSTTKTDLISSINYSLIFAEETFLKPASVIRYKFP